MNEIDFELQMMRRGYKYRHHYIKRRIRKTAYGTESGRQSRGQMYSQPQAQKPQVIDIIKKVLQDAQVNNMQRGY